eukprot:m.185228 g.185228  ORF g.185228 m.185228 type:complete len:97 (+) comp24718_c0_seq1:1211-1501(+)
MSRRRTNQARHATIQTCSTLPLKPPDGAVPPIMPPSCTTTWCNRTLRLPYETSTYTNITTTTPTSVPATTAPVPLQPTQLASGFSPVHQSISKHGG